MDDRDTIRRIKQGVAAGTIPTTFKPRDVNAALKIDWAGVFLPKHREGNPGGETDVFVQVNQAARETPDMRSTPMFQADLIRYCRFKVPSVILP